MKKMLSLFAMLCLSVSSVFAAETYTLDNAHSFVVFHINHFGFSNPTGKWMAEGTLVLDEKNPVNSKADITINIDGLVTGIPKLDEHVKTADFLDAGQFKTATFVSDKIEMIGKDSAKVFGKLTLHGVTKPIVLNVVLNKVGMSPITNKKTAGFTATGTLKRSEFGITKYLPALGDDVKLDIEVEAHQ